MKRIMTVLIFGTSALAFSGAAVSGHGFIGQAKVMEAVPQYETIEVANPVTECWTERVTRNSHRRGSYTAPLAGGIVGGVVGNQFGRGRGKTALTVAGALLGAGAFRVAIWVLAVLANLTAIQRIRHVLVATRD